MIVTLTRGATVEDCLPILDRDGCVILDRLATSAQIEDIHAELEPYLSRTPFGEGDFVGRATKRMGALIVKSAALRDLVMHPTVLGVMAAILGPNCSRIQLNLTQAVQIWPGELAQMYHRDDEMFPYPNKKCEFMVNALWAYDDFTTANGATRVVRSDQRLAGHARTRPGCDRACRDAVWVAADLCRFGNSFRRRQPYRPATHGAHQQLLARLAAPGQESLSRGASGDCAERTLPEPLRQLVGYAIHEPQLGWYEGQDPMVTLQNEVPDTLAARDYVPPAIAEALRQHYEPLRRAAAAE